MGAQFCEIRGYLCGFICSGVASEGKLWLENLSSNPELGDNAFPANRKLLIDMYTQLDTAIQNETFTFDQLIPKKSLSLAIRAYALKKWCYGFLNGLQSVGLPLKQTAASMELLEALQSMTDISELDLEKVNVRDEDEMMLTQVMNYIQDAVIQIYRLLNHAKAKH